MEASVCDPPASSAPIERSAVRGHADSRATESVCMGYGNCTFAGCACQAYVDMYDGHYLCGNCGHHYDLHN